MSSALPASHALCYHYPCPDGAFAGLAAHLRLTADGHAVRSAPQVAYTTPALRAAGVPAMLAPAEAVHLLDFSGGIDFILALCARSAPARVLLVDHHKTALEELAAFTAAGAALPPNLDVHLDMARSGASLARDVYDIAPLLVARLGAAGAARVAALYAHVEDVDLWRHALPGSRAFSAGLAARQLEYDAAANPQLWEQLLALDARELIAEGERLLAAQDALVARELELGAFEVAIPAGPSLGGGGAADAPPLRCLALLTAHPDLRSTTGNELALRAARGGLRAAGAVAYVEPGMGAELAATTLKVSMRSVGGGGSDDDVDVSALARSWGGGGHRNAASFNVPTTVWAGWRVGAPG